MSRIGESRCQPAVTLAVVLLFLPLAGQMLAGRARATEIELTQANLTQAVSRSRHFAPLAPARLAQATASPQAATLRISGSSMAGLTQTLERQFAVQSPQTQVELTSDSTEVALKKLLAGEVDLAAIGRPLTEAEQQAGLVATPVTRHKIAIVVGKANPFSGSLTDVQFARMFRGEMTNWASVGGSNSPIRLVDRPEQDDLRQAFRSYPVFKTAPFRSAPTAVKLTDPTAADLAKALGKNGISYAVVDQVVDNPNLKILQLHKTLPTDARYPFSQPLLYVHKGSPSPQAKAFLSFVQDPANQSLIEQARVADAVASSETTRPTAEPENPGASSSPQPASGGAAEKPTDSAAESLASSAVAQTAPSRPAVVPWWPWLAIPLAGGLLWLLQRNRANRPIVQTSRSGAEMPLTDAPSDSAIKPTSSATTAAAATDAPVPPPDGAVQAGLLTNQPTTSTNGSLELTGHAATAAGAVGAGVLGTDIAGAGVLGAGVVGAGAVGTSAAGTLIDTEKPTGEAVVQGGSQLTEPFLVEAADLRGTAADLAGDAANQNGGCRIILVPRAADQAYVYWEVAPDKCATLQQDGRLRLRIHDVTQLDIDHDPPHDTQEYDCDETQQDLHVAISPGQRDYLAELGYVTEDQHWLRLVRSAPVRSFALNS